MLPDGRSLPTVLLPGATLMQNSRIWFGKKSQVLSNAKIELYHRQRTAIRDIAVTLVNGSPRAKARPGNTFPELPPMLTSAPEKPLCAEGIVALRKAMKLTQVKFAELFGVTARKVSECEHGKSQPTTEQYKKMNSLNKENVQ